MEIIRFNFIPKYCFHFYKRILIMEKVNEIAFDIFLKNFKKNVSKIGLKNSIQKDYILKILYFSTEHLTAEEISNKIKIDYKVSIGIQLFIEL